MHVATATHPRRSIADGVPMRHATAFFALFLTAFSLIGMGCSASHVGDHDSGAIEDGGAVDPDGAIDRDASNELDGGWMDVDAGWCECPAPAPGCHWVGSPCPCSELVCDDQDGGAARFCGGFTGATCADDEFCDFEDPHSCGAADEGGMCAPRPDGCSLIFDPHCGCDGVTYDNECAAHAAGIDALRRGACEPSCAPEDAQGTGACAAIVGYAWDGRGCQWLSGCSCTGADCGRWDSIEECEAAHGMCPIPL